MDIFLNSKYIKHELQRLYIQSRSHKFKCYFKHCSDIAIESHILQRNGILSNLTNDSHLYILKKSDIFSDKSKLKREGLKKVLAYPLFCEKHDEEIFKRIEKYEYDPYQYKIQLLFSYRTFLAEFRKKEINLKYLQSIRDSTRLKILFPDYNHNSLDQEIYSHQLALQDIDYYKFMAEIELFTYENKPNYNFKIFKYNPIGVCVSSLFSPISHTDDSFNNPNHIPSNVIVNIFPKNDELIVILGSCIHLPSTWISNYINSWKTLSQKDVELKVSDLITTRTDTWALSPLVVENNSKINQLLSYWDVNNRNFSESQNFNVNIFDNN